MSPAHAIAQVTPRPIDPGVAHELFLVRADRTVHRKDATVSVEGQRFLCDAALRGRKVTVRYDPRDLSSVVILVEGKRVGRALPQPIGRVAEATPPGHAATCVTRRAQDRLPRATPRRLRPAPRRRRAPRLHP